MNGNNSNCKKVCIVLLYENAFAFNHRRLLTSVVFLRLLKANNKRYKDEKSMNAEEDIFRIEDIPNIVISMVFQIFLYNNTLFKS